MPITIQHGVPASSGLSGLAQTAIQIQAQKELAATPRGGGGWAPRGGAGGGRGGSSAVELEQWRAYNASRQSRQDFGEQILVDEKRAQLKEQGFDYEYTTKQKQDLARNNNAIQQINSSNDFSEDMKASARQRVLLNTAGINLTATPMDLDKKFPEGQAQSLKETWKDEGGNLMGYDRSGNPRVLTKFADTPEGIQSQWDYERRQEMDKFMMNIATEEIRGADGKPTLRTPKQIKEIRENLEAAMGGQGESDIDPAVAEAIYQQGFDRLMGEQQQQQQQQQQDPIAEAQARGINITEAEKDLPPEIAVAQATVRDIGNAYKGKTMPPDVRQEYAAAYDLWKEYIEGPNAQKISRQSGPGKTGLKRKTRKYDRQSAGMSYGVF